MRLAEQCCATGSGLRDAKISSPALIGIDLGIRISRRAAAGMLERTANFVVVRTMQDGGVVRGGRYANGGKRRRRW